MSTSHRSSSASANCHLEWRPSRWVAGWLLALIALTPLAVLVSAMPRPLAWAVAPLMGLVALRAFRLYIATPPCRLVVRAEGPLSVGDRFFECWRLHWRGPLAFIEWQEGRSRHALAFWPDTLPPSLRRELRLATPAHSPDSGVPGMAP